MASAYPKSLYPNVAFYENRVIAAPNDAFIDDILNKWYGNITLLENNHFYIQWLFPNTEGGNNQHSFPLTPEEAKIIREREDLKKKVKTAFEMMLNFYGMRLVGNNQFKLTENGDKILTALNIQYNHNYQRITRILKALLQLGYSNLMLPWLKFLADLIYKEKKLTFAHFSFEKYWIDTLDAEDKLALMSYVDTLPKLKPTDSTTHGKPSDTTENITSTTTTTNTKPPIVDIKSNNMPKDFKVTGAGITETTSNSDISDTSFQSKKMKTSSISTRKSKIIDFYRNEIPFEPNGDYISNILKTWSRDPVKLTKNTHYIYWLFPSSLPGSLQSPCARLTDEEAKVFQETSELKSRLLSAFKMMLNFYGMNLDRHNYFEMVEKTRLMKLNEKNCHHHKHITRILCALKELGYKELMLPWMKFLASLIFSNKIIPKASTSFKEHWINMLERRDREKIMPFITTDI